MNFNFFFSLPQDGPRSRTFLFSVTRPENPPTPHCVLVEVQQVEEDLYLGRCFVASSHVVKHLQKGQYSGNHNHNCGIQTVINQ